MPITSKFKEFEWPLLYNTLKGLFDPLWSKGEVDGMTNEGLMTRQDVPVVVTVNLLLHYCPVAIRALLPLNDSRTVDTCHDFCPLYVRSNLIDIPWQGFYLWKRCDPAVKLHHLTHTIIYYFPLNCIYHNALHHCTHIIVPFSDSGYQIKKTHNICILFYWWLATKNKGNL